MDDGSTADPLLGSILAGKYRIEREIARGGMGAIYLATQEPLGRKVAIKVLRYVFGTESLREVEEVRFLREARAISKLTDPHTVTLYDYGALDEGGLYFVMEYLRGRTLAKLLQQRRYLPWPAVVHIVRQICASLGEAHRHGLIHRDLKPLNVMLTERSGDESFVKVLDFGLVKPTREAEAVSVTQVGAIMGSPAYMSPEQVFGERVDTRSDLYSLGVMMYEMLTGALPFTVDTEGRVRDVLKQHLMDKPEPMAVVHPGLEVPQLLDLAVMRCMGKQPDDRFANVEQLLAVLDDIPMPDDPHLSLAPEEAADSPSDADPSTADTMQYVPEFAQDSDDAVQTLTVGAESELAPSPRQAPPKQSKAAFIVALIALFGAFGIVLVMFINHEPYTGPSVPPVGAGSMYRSPEDQPRPKPKAKPAPVSETKKSEKKPPSKVKPEAPKPPPSSSKSVVIQVSFESKPVGATVYRGDKAIGTTPFSLDVARSAFPLKVTYRLKGHQDEGYTLLDAPENAMGKLKAHAELTRLRPRKKRKRPKRSSSGPQLRDKR